MQKFGAVVRSKYAVPHRFPAAVSTHTIKNAQITNSVYSETTSPDFEHKKKKYIQLVQLKIMVNIHYKCLVGVTKYIAGPTKCLVKATIPHLVSPSIYLVFQLEMYCVNYNFSWTNYVFSPVFFIIKKSDLSSPHDQVNTVPNRQRPDRYFQETRVVYQLSLNEST
ncbi:uncharacterized protein LOC126840997 [Adelges cooleyi]|uniref:uncharacterized protein LOC126840997 n=1 Tax=Adelges cooleyi TaxID=133065 RepID=UPI00218014F5|nr:uncharacterized protein LOC126840997 [Adelges cooleyi]